MKIIDMAKSLVMLSGLEPGKDIEIKVTGLKPGEKMHEELMEDPAGHDSSENGRVLDILTNRKYTGGMIMELLGHKDYVRILLALEKKPLRFGEIQKVLALNPAQVDRALTFLRDGLLIIPKTVPAEKGPIRVEYGIGKRGAAFLASWRSFRDQAQRHAADLGRAEVAELQSLSR